VRRALRRDPSLSYEQVLELWSAAPGGHAEEADAVREVYGEERAMAASQSHWQTDPRHGRKVLITAALWVAAHLVILAAVDVPIYVECTRSSTCGQVGFGPALTAFSIGWVQLMYGVVTGAVLSRTRPAISQGVFIGTAIVTIGFTFLCFGLVGVH
jgi:hypothetical protein